MKQRNISLTVYLDGPFWVGVFERLDGGKLQAAKVIFGAEPKDAEVFEQICDKWHQLSFSAAVTVPVRQPADSPKRRQRAAAKAIAARGVSTKSQLALSHAREAGKTERRQEARQRREMRAQQAFEQRQRKRKEKHRGH